MNVGEKIEFELITSSWFTSAAMHAAAQIAHVFPDFEDATWAAEILRRLCLHELDQELQELVLESESKSYVLADFLDSLARQEPMTMGAGSGFAKTIRLIVRLRHVERLVREMTV